MAEGFVVEVTGDKEFMRSMNRLDKIILNRILNAGVEDITKYAATAARHFAPTRSGFLRNSIIAEPSRRSGLASFEAEAGISRRAHYGIYVDQGTGLYGYKKSLIHPNTANFMVWISPSHGLWRAKTTKGQRGQHFMLRAYELTRNVYVPAKLELMKAEIKAAM